MRKEGKKEREREGEREKRVSEGVKRRRKWQVYIKMKSLQDEE